MKVSLQRELSIEDIRERLGETTGRLEMINFAHYSFEKSLLDEYCNLFREYSRMWEGISFHACSSITDQLVIPFLFSLQNPLTTLDLSSCKITDKSVIAISHSLHSQTLKILKLGSSLIHDSSIIELSAECPLLSELYLAGCSKITDIGVIQSLKAKTRVNGVPFSVLMLGGCKSITDSSLIYLAKAQGEYLTKLSLSFCHKLTDKSIETIAESSPELQTVNLCGCKQIGDKSVKSLFDNCPKLSSGSFNSCMQVTISSLELLENNPNLLPKLYYLDFRECPILKKELTKATALANTIQSRSTNVLHIKL